MSTEWINRWNDVIGTDPEMPGVWRRKAGGFRIRARVVCPKTGKRVEINRALPNASRASHALETLVSEKAALRERLAAEAAAAPAVDPNAPPLFAVYAVDLFKRKLQRGKTGEPKRGIIVSAKGREKWGATLTKHLIPAFGPMPVNMIRRATIEKWLDGIKVGSGTREKGVYSARSVNTWLAILRTIIRAAAKTYEFAPPDMDDLELAAPPVYTEEEPNSLRPEDVPRFLEELHRRYPQHYAMTLLGFSTGLRPSSLRPLRASGRGADLLWDEGALLIRRSQTRGAPMESTKTGKRQRILMPPALVEALKAHAEVKPKGRAKPTDRMQASELLFPSTSGGFRSASCLDKPFDEVAEAIGLTYKISPRAMRRTYQDLARAAGVDDIVTRAISGHATEAMQHHYSTVAATEMQSALAKVIDIATARRSA